ncbi:hypothetical protein INT44_007610 [Umbelopsis vinacea]|uniref:Uncharacterized protein n=1 Tax=Umbelopsis vinacea TaxID=44442 RepID=A0A8H7UB69_9FUNG|nr:hypothetical protein INT44_007610 [Umbelopsis vinacea]
MNTSQDHTAHVPSPFANLSIMAPALVGINLPGPMRTAARPTVEELKDWLISAKQRTKQLKGYVKSGHMTGLEKLATMNE